MNMEQIETLANNVKQAQETEFSAKVGLGIVEQHLEQTKINVVVSAHENKPELFDGLKVAQIAQQEQQVINTSQAVKNATEAVSAALDVYETAKRNRMFHENVLSLTRAWLYSQRGIEAEKIEY